MTDLLKVGGRKWRSAGTCSFPYIQGSIFLNGRTLTVNTLRRINTFDYYIIIYLLIN